MNLPPVYEANVFRPGLQRSATLSHGCGALQILKDLTACLWDGTYGQKTGRQVLGNL